jgi:gliding motility-associated-like protein
VQLEAITEQNCRDTARQILIVNPVPKPIAMANYDEQCFNNQVYDFYSNTLLNNGDYESFWTLPEFGEIHADSLFDLRFSSIGIKNIKYKAVSDSGCADSMLFAIEVYASPQASFVLDTNASCLKYNEITAQNTTNILAGTVSQYWYKDEFELISTDENLAYRFADSGWFWVRLKALSGEGCADTVSRQVRLFQEPVAQFTAVFMDSCFYDHELFVNSSAFGFNGDIRSDFELSDYSAFNNTNDFSYKFTTFDTFFVQQIVTDEVGCADTTTQQVIVRPQPLARINADIIQPCLRVNQFDFRDSTLANGVAYVRTWELVDENHFSSDSILKYAYSQDGDKTIYLSADGPFGCSTKDSFYVKVLPKNELHYLLSDNSYCFKEQELSFEYVGEVDFADLDGLWWEFGDGITETTESGQKLFANTGLFASQLISLNEFGCYDTLDFAIEIKPNPIADFELNSSLWCFNNQAIVFDSKASLSFGNIARYEWDFDDGTSSNFARVDDKKYNASGGYYIRHVVEGDNECRDTSFKDILIVKNPEASHTSLSYDECFKGNEFTIENTSMVYDNISKTYWTLPSEGVLDSGQLFTFSLSKAGNAQFRLVIIDELGCSDTTTGEITVHPQANIDFESDTVCLLQENTMRSLSTIDSGTIVSHDWLLGDGTIASGESISHTFSNSGSYTITHYTSSNFGCKDTLEKVGIAVVRELPTVSFTYEKILDSLRITGYQFTNGSTGNEPLSHNWTFDMFGFSSDRNPYFEFSDTGLTYITLEVTDVFGCQDTNSQLIRIIPSNNIYIPSAFSPNGDGLNDVFKPEGMPYSIRYKMEIYNRWGELLFVSNDLNKGWDGTYKGVLLNQDIFIYKIVLLDINNNFVNKKGTVTLLR